MEVSVQASSHLPLDKVLYVSDFPVNLLSISAIIKNLFYFVTFFPYHCVFSGPVDMKEDWFGLWSLKRPSSVGPFEILKGLLCSVSKAESSFWWHCRLGRLCFCKLQQALPWITIKSFTCECCELGKHHRVTFRRPSTFVSESPFELNSLWYLRTNLSIVCVWFSLQHCLCG